MDAWTPSEEQHLMRETCRQFCDDVVIPYIRQNWQREWDMNPDARLPPEILEGCERNDHRTFKIN